MSALAIFIALAAGRGRILAEDPMPRRVVIDELFVTLRVPADLPDAAAEAVRQALAGPAFLPRLREAVRAVVRGCPELASVRVTVTR